MAISQSRYVDITSGVGAGAAASTRELIGRFFSTNSLIPTGTSLEFTSADEVATYFGSASDEYKRALFYFGWVSKNITSPKKISFARWADSATPATIYGAVADYTLADFTGISSGGFEFTLGGTTITLTGIDLTGAGSLSAVAALIQTAIRAQTSGGTDWTSALVTYNSTRKSFDFEGGLAGAGSAATGTITLDTNVSPGVRATGTVTFTTNAAANDTVVINGTTITFVASGATGNQVNIGATSDDTASALQTFLAASADTNIAKMTYTVATNVVTCTSVLYGTVGNSYTLAKTGTHITVSGAVLTGGVAADTLTVNGIAITFVASGATGNQVLVGVSAAATAANIQTFLSAATDPELLEATYATVSNVTTITYREIGTQGNSFTLAKSSSNITISGATLTGGTDISGIAVEAAPSGVDIAAPLGWLAGAILSDGSDAQTITALLSESAAESNNFGSFAFVGALTLDDVTEAATWNLAQNNSYLYSVPVLAADRDSWYSALSGIGGTTLTLAPLSTEYPEQEPMMILAATDYTQANSVQNFMFQQFALTPSVITNANANIYDALRINYYGQTQTAGQLISFYQRGVMMGLPTDALDQNTYANEIWLKDAASAAIMTLLLALSRVSADNTGRAQILSVVQDVINQAVNNGTISIGKPLTSAQKLTIASITADPNAWQQVENTGYWVNVEIIPYIESSTTKYKARYTLIYSKDDIIRKVEGRDVLI